MKIGQATLTLCTLVMLLGSSDRSDCRELPHSIAMKHLLTADYLATWAVSTKKDPSVIAPWVTWVSTTWQANKAAVAAGLKTMFYTDPNRVQGQDPMYSDDEAVFAHDCAGNRISSTLYRNQYLTDPASAVLQDKWKKYVAHISGGVHWDAIFTDDTDTIESTTGAPCAFTRDAWLTATKSQIAAIFPTPVIYNGVNVTNATALNSIPNVLGGMYEGCYADARSRPSIWEPYWSHIENAELAMARDKKFFFCYGNDNGDASQSTSGRMYSLASFFLTYDPKTSILWELYEGPSHFHVQPESQLVPMSPLQAAPDTVKGLKLSTGVYGREYAACYFAGKLVGTCASVVNPDRFDAHSYPYGTKYTRTLVLSGGGVLDGGKATINGSSPPPALQPLQGLVVFGDTP